MGRLQLILLCTADFCRPLSAVPPHFCRQRRPRVPLPPPPPRRSLFCVVPPSPAPLSAVAPHFWRHRRPRVPLPPPPRRSQFYVVFIHRIGALLLKLANAGLVPAAAASPRRPFARSLLLSSSFGFAVVFS